MKELLLVMLGGGFGAILRYFVTVILQTKLKFEHWATFWVNITGCFILGLLFETIVKSGHSLYLFGVVGLIGSYTTFSAFEYENIDLIAHERYLEFVKYTTFSCGFAILAVLSGAYIAKILGI